MTGRLVGVGVGPGDPGLVTVRAVETLQIADAVFVPVAAPPDGAPGYAERVVRAHLPHVVRIHRLEFSIEPDPDVRRRSWRQAAEAVAAAVDDGGTAAFATIGDPNLYSTFSHLARDVRTLVPGVAVETVPGITAMQDLAARSGTTLAEGGQTVALLPMTAGRGRLRAALQAFDTVVLYKGGSRLPEVRDLLAATGRGAGAVYGARLGLDGEDVRDGGELPPTGPYLSTVIVPPPGRPAGGDTAPQAADPPPPGQGGGQVTPRPGGNGGR